MIVDRIRAMHPEIDWASFDEASRALTWELFYGPMQPDYWTNVEPLEHYTWRGFQQAVKDISMMLEMLPGEVYVDVNDPDSMSESDPENDSANWVYFCEQCGEIIYEGEESEACSAADSGRLAENSATHVIDINKEPAWVGGEWELVNPRALLLHTEIMRLVS